MKRTARWLLLAVISMMAIVMVIAACGGGDDDDASEPAPAIATGGGESYPASGSASGAEAPRAVVSEADGSANYDASAQLSGAIQRMVIRTADITLVVDDLEEGMRMVRRIAGGANGLVFASSSSFQGDYQVATLTIDVPSDRFDAVISELRADPIVTKVEYEAISSQDVTEEYLDLDSRLRNLEASEARFLDLLSSATRLEDILRIESELTRVRGEVEQITGRKKYLEARTDLSRITISLRPESAPSTRSSESSFEFVKVVEDAWQSSLNFMGTVLEVVITVVVFFWWLWPLAIAGWLGYNIIRTRRRSPKTAPSEHAP